jgi:GAF domain-containing protein
MISDLLEVERCSIFLYDGVKDQLYCKVITGRLREAISFEREKPNILSQVFNTGQTAYVKDCASPDGKQQCGEYLTLNQKLHTATRNVLITPIKLGNNAIGCLEVANKKKVQDFTTNDMGILASICD